MCVNYAFGYKNDVFKKLVSFIFISAFYVVFFSLAQQKRIILLNNKQTLKLPSKRLPLAITTTICYCGCYIIVAIVC